MSVLVTGASGFIGRAFLKQALEQTDFPLRAVVRSTSVSPPVGVETVVVPELSGKQDWTSALSDCEVVVHAAARVHVLQKNSLNALNELRRVNVEATMNLAHQAAAVGVKRFVFLSTVKVHGELTLPGRPFRADDTPAPTDPYAMSKLEAERGLRLLAEETGMEVVIVRPPLVYGPGVKANFLNLLRWVARGVPLPLGAIDNRRSLVALNNLVDLLMLCIEQPAAANRTFLVSDGEDLSTADLLRRIAAAMGRKITLLPVPPAALETGLRIIGKQALADRLCGSLQVDIAKTRDLLGWKPIQSVDDGLKETVARFLETR